MLGFYKCDSTYSSCLIGNNQQHKLAQCGEGYYLKIYECSLNPAPLSAAMACVFTLVHSSFYTEKFISTVRLSEKKPCEAEGAEYRQQLFKCWSAVGQS